MPPQPLFPSTTSSGSSPTRPPPSRSSSGVAGPAHTNGIESQWALLKRGHMGTHHSMSKKHLHRYVDEFNYRRSVGMGNDPETLGRTLDGMMGKHLRYRQLVG